MMVAKQEWQAVCASDDTSAANWRESLYSPCYSRLSSICVPKVVLYQPPLSVNKQQKPLSHPPGQRKTDEFAKRDARFIIVARLVCNPHGVSRSVPEPCFGGSVIVSALCDTVAKVSFKQIALRCYKPTNAGYNVLMTSIHGLSPLREASGGVACPICLQQIKRLRSNTNLLEFVSFVTMFTLFGWVPFMTKGVLLAMRHFFRRHLPRPCCLPFCAGFCEFGLMFGVP
jgi:hypothetical protein